MPRTTLSAVGLLALAGLLLALSFTWPGTEPPRTVGAVLAAAVATPTQPATRTPAETGRTLFAIKGCATCHRHDGLEAHRLSHGGEVIPISESFLAGSAAPNLTAYQADPDFLRTWLKDPQTVRPNTSMPDLGLREEEIEALIDFLQVNITE